MNIPLLCIPIAFGLVYLPKIALSVAMARQPEGYDNKHPRDQQAKLAGWGKRAGAAHANGFESFAPFGIGVLVATSTGAHPEAAAQLALGYIAARTIYPIMYLANIDKLRSLIWTAGIAATVGLMLLPLL